MLVEVLQTQLLIKVIALDSVSSLFRYGECYDGGAIF